MRPECIVPLAMDRGSVDLQPLHLGITDLDARWLWASVQSRLDPQARRGGGVAAEADAHTEAALGGTALGGDDVVAAPRWRRPRGVPLPAGVLAVADQRLLLGLDGDDRLGALLEVPHPGGDGLDLRVAIRMLAACARLARPAQRRRRIPPWGRPHQRGRLPA
jgi:hypothetical protein